MSISSGESGKAILIGGYCHPAGTLFAQPEVLAAGYLRFEFCLIGGQELSSVDQRRRRLHKKELPFPEVTK
jgi:hypothetical protein